MASLSVSNTFIDGTTILATPMNTNFDDIETYVNNRNSGAAEWERVLATNASSVPGVFNNGAGTNDILNAQDNGTTVFAVKDGGSSVFGSAALLTTATDGFPYIPSCPGLPTGVATANTGRIPIVIDSSNNRMYFYNSGWQNVANNPGVDNSTIELNSNLLRVKNGLTIQTLNIGTALQYKTFASLPILQIQSYTTATSTVITSSSFSDTALTGSFTPKINTSKVFIFVAGNFAQDPNGVGYLTVSRNGTSLAATLGGYCLTVGPNTLSAPVFVYDSPATTSAITYTVQIRTNGTGNAIFPVTDGGVYTSSANMIIVEVAQ